MTWRAAQLGRSRERVARGDQSMRAPENRGHAIVYRVMGGAATGRRRVPKKEWTR